MKHHRRTDLVLGALASLTVGVIFLGDLWTPSQIDFSPLAAVPVAVAAWFARSAYPFVLACALLLTVTAVAGGGISVESGAAAAASCVGLAFVIRLAAWAGLGNPEAAPAWIRSLLPAAPRAPVQSTRHQPLTRREREVVELAADGLTAREIGAALFIGERTVETHLANSYAKLGISSKRDLVLQKARANSG